MNQPNKHNNGTPTRLKVVSWNVNGIKDKRAQLREIQKQTDPDIIFLNETNHCLAINMYSELGYDTSTYRVVQIKSTATFRGGMIAIIKMELRLETAEILRMSKGNDFAQTIVLTDKENRGYIGWYNSPVMDKDTFSETLRRLITEYDTQIIIGDFNARHTR